MNTNKEDSTKKYGETITRKNIKPLYVSLEDMIPDYSELIEQHESNNTEKSASV